jgi:hypothetical protein
MPVEASRCNLTDEWAGAGDLLELIAPPRWTRHALCRRYGELPWVTERPPTSSQTEQMRRVCEKCPVRRQCGVRATERPSGGFLASSWHPLPGGTSPPAADERECVECRRRRGPIVRGYCPPCYQRLRRAAYRDTTQRDTDVTREG